MRSALALVLMVLASGCTMPDDGKTPSTPSPTPPAYPAHSERPVPAPTLKTDLAVLLQVADRWVRPSDFIVANATAPLGASVAWFLAPRNPIVPGEDRIDYVPATLGIASQGGASLDARMSQLGRYAYEARGSSGVRFNVTVVSALPPGGFEEVFFVEDEHGARFAPSELVVGRDTIVSVRDLAARDVEAVRVDQMLRVAPDGPTASVTPPTLLGDYDLVALARDGGDGWGEASVRIIVDSRKPDANVTLGPWTGTLALAQTATPEDHAFESRFNYSRLNFTFTATSSAPGDASVRVSVLDATGRALATMEGPSGSLELRDVPNGTHAVRVEAVSGVQVSWRVEGAGFLELVPPMSFFHT